MVLRFQRWLTAQNYHPFTVAKYGKFASAFCRFIGEKCLREIVPIDISDFITANMPSGWSERLVNDRLGGLRSFFDFLYLGGAVDTVPPRFIRPRRLMNKVPRVPTQAQVVRLLSATRKPRDRALLELLYATGCRLCEVLPLKVEDIDFGAREIHVKGKRKERVVYFGRPAARALRQYLRGRKNGYLFRVAYPTQTGHVHATQRTWEGEYAIYPHGVRVKKLVYLGMLGKVSRAEAQTKLAKHVSHVDLRRPVQDRPLSTAGALKVLRAAGHRIGLAFFSARMLRHSYATHLWENGADIMVIQELLGHNWLNSTQVYVSVADRTVAKTFRHLHPRGR